MSQTSYRNSVSDKNIFVYSFFLCFCIRITYFVLNRETKIRIFSSFNATEC